MTGKTTDCTTERQKLQSVDDIFSSLLIELEWMEQWYCYRATLRRPVKVIVPSMPRVSGKPDG